jgi:hypothetical protein
VELLRFQRVKIEAAAAGHGYQRSRFEQVDSRPGPSAHCGKVARARLQEGGELQADGEVKGRGAPLATAR